MSGNRLAGTPGGDSRVSAFMAVWILFFVLMNIPALAYEAPDSYEMEKKTFMSDLSLSPGEVAIFHWDPVTATLSELETTRNPPGINHLETVLKGYPEWTVDDVKDAFRAVEKVPLSGRKVFFAQPGNGGMEGWFMVENREGVCTAFILSDFTPDSLFSSIPKGSGDVVDFTCSRLGSVGNIYLVELHRNGSVTVGRRIWPEDNGGEDGDVIPEGRRLFSTGRGTTFIASVDASSLKSGNVTLITTLSSVNGVSVMRIKDGNGRLSVEPLGGPSAEAIESHVDSIDAASGAVAVFRDSEASLPDLYLFRKNGSAERWSCRTEKEGSPEWTFMESWGIPLKNPLPAWGDVTGDGVPDLVVVGDKGQILAWKGKVSTDKESKENYLHPVFYRKDSERIFCETGEVWFSSPSVREVDRNGRKRHILYLADIDGVLHVYDDDGELYALDLSDRIGRFPVISVVPDGGGMSGSDFEGDLLLCGTADGRLVLFNIGNSSDEVRHVCDFTLPGDVSFAAPSAVDMDGDGHTEIFIGSKSGEVRLFRLIGGSGSGSFELKELPALEGLEKVKYADPAAGDLNGDGVVDVVIGGGDGTVAFYEGMKEISGGITFRRLQEFDGLDLGEHVHPTLHDVDGDGNSELVAGNAEGRLLVYKFANGTISEIGSWQFQPVGSVVTEADYYSGSYIPEYFEVSGFTDTLSANRLIALLEKVDRKYRDEVAFSIGALPPDILRTMLRMHSESLLLDNARQIYRMAERLDYVKIFEDGDSTTLVYKMENGKENRLPPSIYYWWVVHPRILYEIPAAVDVSYWGKPPEFYGLDHTEWLRHEPERSIYAPSSEGAFWRNILPDDRRYGESLMDAVDGASTLDEGLNKLYEWLTWRRPDGFMTFGYKTQDLQPMVILAKHYGSCGEQSILAAAVLRTALVPVRVVGCRGEDHQWNELWIDGNWVHLDINDKIGDGIDRPWNSGEGRDHKAKTISTITGWRGDEKLLDVTRDVHNPEGSGYTKAGRGYTDTGHLGITVTDNSGDPVDGALVILRSHWNGRNMATIWKYTSVGGKADFDLGYEPEGGYTLEILSPFGTAGSSNLPIIEGHDYHMSYSLPGSKNGFGSLWVDKGSGWNSKISFLHSPTHDMIVGKDNDYGNNRMGNITVSVTRVKGEFTAPALVGSRRVKSKGYLWKEYGFRGVTGGRIEVEATPADLSFAMIDADIATKNVLDISGEFGGGGSGLLKLFTEWKSGDSEISFPMDKEIFFAIANRKTDIAALEGEIGFVFEKSVDPPFIKVEAADTPVREVHGDVGDNLGVERLDVSFDGGVSWHDATESVSWMKDSEISHCSGHFEYKPESMQNDFSLPSGNYDVMFRVVDQGDEKTYSNIIDFETGKWNMFTNQPLSQDNPDSPLPSSSWMFGPFRLPGDLPYLEMRTKGHTMGMDLDLFLFCDSNGNGIVDDMKENIAKSAGPSSMERIYLDEPSNGLYWIYVQGWSVPAEGGLFDLRLSESVSTIIAGERSPVGSFDDTFPGKSAYFSFNHIKNDSKSRVVQGSDGLAVLCKYVGPSVLDSTGTEMFLNGRNMRKNIAIEPDRVVLFPVPDLVEGTKNEVICNLRDMAGFTEKVSWTFTLDRTPPSIEIVDPFEGEWIPVGDIRVAVRVVDNLPLGLKVTCNPGTGETVILKRMKPKGNYFTGTVKITKKNVGMVKLVFSAEDAAGHKKESIRKIRIYTP